MCILFTPKDIIYVKDTTKLRNPTSKMVLANNDIEQ